jgi:hypothetical protein
MVKITSKFLNQKIENTYRLPTDMKSVDTHFRVNKNEYRFGVKQEKMGQNKDNKSLAKISFRKPGKIIEESLRGIMKGVIFLRCSSHKAVLYTEHSLFRSSLYPLLLPQ